MAIPLRAVVAKPGLDGHDRGAKVIARALRDAGFEVIYTGLHRTPEEIVRTCLEEDVDVLLVSLLSGAHMVLVPEIITRLREAGLAELPVLVGGIIPPADARKLVQEHGVAAVMGPGTPLSEIVATAREKGQHYREKVKGPGGQGLIG